MVERFQEVATYLILDGHVKNFTTLVCGAQFFNSLTPEQQKMHDTLPDRS